MIQQRKLCSILAALSVAVLVSCDRPSSSQPEPQVRAGSPPVLEQIAKLQGGVTFTLEDGEARNREHPDTFWIPPKESRENLVKDDLVKLIFNLTDGEQTQGERMWVIVKGGDGSGYTGTLDNDPYSTDQIKAGHKISFEPRHVIEIPQDESPKTQNAGKEVADQPTTAPESKPQGDQNVEPELGRRFR